MPQEQLSSSRAPTCHPKRKHVCKGLCWPCYRKQVGRKDKRNHLGGIDLREIAALSGITIIEAKKVFHAIIKIMKDDLLAGRNFRIQGWGTMCIVKRKPLVNPIDPNNTRYIRFRPSLSIRVSLNKDLHAD